jgi:pimeloyl-ACP methyl ester carboxylesterase
MENGVRKMMTLSDPKEDKSTKVPAESFFKEMPHISLDVIELDKDTPTHLNLIHLKNTQNPNGMTIMYCHGNSSCLGRLYPYMVQICNFGQVDIVAVEYPGYGTIKGKPTDDGLLRNVFKAYKHVVNQLSISPKKLVVYGQSMGTGPTTFIGAHPDYPVAGIVTEGAFASGFKLFSKNVRNSDQYLV